MEVRSEIKSFFKRVFVQLQNSNDDDKKNWIKLLNKQIQLHNKAIRSDNFDIGVKNKLQSYGISNS